MRVRRSLLILAFGVGLVLHPWRSSGAADIQLTRLPAGGLQPQVVAAADGTLHLVFFKGDPKSGDLLYVRRMRGAKEFSDPMRINTEPGAAVALGTIRGGQIALGMSGRPHVVWNGSGKAASHAGAPMLYSRLNDAGTSFEPQRDLMGPSFDLDGGGSVAADGAGNVYVAWHGHAAGTPADEGNRFVFLASSTNEGAAFSRERKVNPDSTGACGCCGMKAFAEPRGDLYLLYRAAHGGVERGETLLVSKDRGGTFRELYVHPWKSSTCPMSSAWLGATTSDRVAAAWETAGRVWFTRIGPGAGEVSKPVAPDGGSGQKHPVIVAGATGETLLVWTEGTGWGKGGAVAWQVFDAKGAPRGPMGRVDGLPVWSFATACANDRGFEILY